MEVNLDVYISAVVQNYATNVYGEDVMIGNDVLLKCAIPSFLADFLSVTGWVGSEGAQIRATQDYNLGNILAEPDAAFALFLVLECKDELDPERVSTTKCIFVFETEN